MLYFDVLQALKEKLSEPEYRDYRLSSSGRTLYVTQESDKAIAYRITFKYAERREAHFVAVHDTGEERAVQLALELARMLGCDLPREAVRLGNACHGESSGGTNYRITPNPAQPAQLDIYLGTR